MTCILFLCNTCIAVAWIIHSSRTAYWSGLTLIKIYSFTLRGKQTNKQTKNHTTSRPGKSNLDLSNILAFEYAYDTFWNSENNLLLQKNWCLHLLGILMASFECILGKNSLGFARRIRHSWGNASLSSISPICFEKRARVSQNKRQTNCCLA